MRAVPRCARFDSSNLDPFLFKRKGAKTVASVQIVALNWQSWDEGMMLIEVMFASENGWALSSRRDIAVTTCQSLRRKPFPAER